MATLCRIPRGRALSLAPVGSLHSPRLLLRPYSLTDAEPVFEAIDETRASLTQWVPDIGCRRTIRDVQTGLANLITSTAVDNGPIVMGIWQRFSHQFLGEVGLYSIDHERGVGEVGYWLRRRARGNGYISEAVRTLATYAKANVGVSRLEAHIAVENVSSRRVVERLGFDITGHRAPAPRWDGEVGDVLIYALEGSIANAV